MSDHFTLRLPTDTAERLRRRAARTGVAPRTLAQRYIEEGVRHDDHPLIRFVDRPTGRRAAIVGTGLDVWEAIMVLRANDNDIEATAEQLERPVGLIQAAVAYFGDYRDEIDARIRANEEEAEQGYAAWVAGQQALAT